MTEQMEIVEQLDPITPSSAVPRLPSQRQGEISAPIVGRKRRLTFLRRSWSLKIGLGILGFYLLLIVISRFWTPYPPGQLGVGDSYVPPGRDFLLGTDQLGQDVLSRLMAGTIADLGIVVAAVGIALVLGTVLGTIAGYFGGAADAATLRGVEIIQAFPVLLLAMLIVTLVGAGFVNVILVMAFIGMPEYARLARAEVMTRRNWQFSEAAQLMGARPTAIAFRHLLPNSMGPVVAFTSINAAAVVLSTASLGFLGLGLPPGTAEWGAMIADGRTGIVTGDWWVSFFPGLAIVGLAAAFYFIGDALSDLTDPRRRRA